MVDSVRTNLIELRRSRSLPRDLLLSFGVIVVLMLSLRMIHVNQSHRILGSDAPAREKPFFFFPSVGMARSKKSSLLVSQAAAWKLRSGSTTSRERSGTDERVVSPFLLGVFYFPKDWNFRVDKLALN